MRHNPWAQAITAALSSLAATRARESEARAVKCTSLSMMCRRHTLTGPRFWEGGLRRMRNVTPTSRARFLRAAVLHGRAAARFEALARRP